MPVCIYINVCIYMYMFKHVCRYVYTCMASTVFAVFSFFHFFFATHGTPTSMRLSSFSFSLFCLIFCLLFLFFFGRFSFSFGIRHREERRMPLFFSLFFPLFFPLFRSTASTAWHMPSRIAANAEPHTGRLTQFMILILILIFNIFFSFQNVQNGHLPAQSHIWDT